MTRENMFTKIVAWLICAVMIIGMIPNVSLPAAAAENDWEGDIDVVETTEPPVGSESNPEVAYLGDNTAPEGETEYHWVYVADYTGILVITEGEVATEQAVTEGEEIAISSLSFNLAYKAGSCEAFPVYLTEMENTVTNEGTVYYATRHNGATMTITGSDYVVYYGEETYTPDDNGVVTMEVVVTSMWSPFIFQIEGDEELTINFAYPEGSSNNPAIAYLGYNGCTIEAGNSDGYYYTYIADYTGTLIVEVENYDGGWSYAINNMTSYSYGNTQWSDSDPVVNPAEIAVKEGDEIQIIVNTYDAENPYTNPGGDLSVYLSYPEGSVEAYPIYLTELENTVTNEGTVYYATRHNGATMTITGSDYVVYYGEETYTPDDDGVVTMEVVVASMWSPFSFQIEGDGELTINFVYPAGSQSNPAVAVLGDNVASIEAGSEGYYWTYTADEDGDLLVTVDTDAAGWFYVINNITAGTYGDSQWSDSDPVVNPATITVAAGDEIQIIVNTYDADNMWSNPAGDITVNLAYAEEGPIVDENLKFATISLAFADYIGVQPIMYLSAVKNYDSYYVELVYSEYGVDPVTSILEPIEGSTTSYNVYELAVLPRSMTAGIQLTIYAEKDGVLYCGNTVDTSIENLALEKIAQFYTSGQLARCKILVDMLNYGAAVQERFTTNTAYPNLNLGDYAELGTADTPEMDAVVSKTGEYTVSVLKDTLGLGSKVEVQFIFRASAITENYELRYVLDGETYTIPASSFDTESMSGYAVAIFALKPRHFRNEMTVALYDTTTDQPVTQVYTNSVEAYALNQIGTVNEAAAIAMMKYGDAVIAYFAS